MKVYELQLYFAIVLLISSSFTAFAAAPTKGELATAHKWAQTYLKSDTSGNPYSFVYAGKPSSELLKTWVCARDSKKLDENRVQYISTYTDSETGLQVRCVSVEYADYPTVEWTVYLKNIGSAATPIISDIQALDFEFKRSGNGEFILHHNVGSPCQPNDFQPLETPLGPNASTRITAAGGRPTNSDLSYFNIEWCGKGVIAVVGWPGQWAASFMRDNENGLRIRAGQELTHMKLNPGEEIRTPLMVLQFWNGDKTHSQNVWRSWMVKHNLPRPGGKLVPTEFGSCHGNMMPKASEEIEMINGWIRERIKLDYWTLDAGWYPNNGSWANTGTWEPDQERFPNGMRQIADLVHANGCKFSMWFEPERVAPGTWLYEKHPEWLLKTADDAANTPQIGNAPYRLLNLGNPEALKWVTNYVDKMLVDQGIDTYRQDFNIDPLEYWRANDASDRQGITENAYICGYLAYWDELLRRNPNRLIDTCASGGRRNDLETLRRSVPLLRSDYFSDPISQQAQTLGLSEWFPYYGSGTGSLDKYIQRSSVCPSYRIGALDMSNKSIDFTPIRKMVDDFRQIKDYFMGDFYPLTSYSLEKNVWAAWQFNRPELGEGVVQAFRRPDCPAESSTFKLKGLDIKSNYIVTNLDTQKSEVVAGKKLVESGLVLAIIEKPGSSIVTYKKTK